MQNDIPNQQAPATGEYIPTQHIPVWAPKPSGATQAQRIEAWAPDHSDSLAGRPWKPETAGTGAFARAQMTDAITCEPSFDETAEGRNAELEAEARGKAHLYCLGVKQALKAARDEARRIENALVPVVGAFSDEDILDYTGDWDLTSSDDDSDGSWVR